MPSLKTNLLRISFKEQHHLYEVRITCKSSIEAQHSLEISRHFEQILPNSLYQHPLLYSPDTLPISTYFTHLSNGHPVQLQLTPTSSQSGSQIGSLIATKLMLITRLLYSPQLSACFNPFQEQVMQSLMTMPGWQVTAEVSGTAVFLCISGVELQIYPAESLNETSQILLNHDSGKFFLKQNIVRVDKDQGEVHFRSGLKCRRQALHPISLLPLSGFSLAQNIQSFLVRIKDCCISFSEAWELQMDSRFLDVQASFPSAGVLGFRQNVDKSLSSLISPMSKNNFVYNYVSFFNDVKFEDVLNASLVFFSEEDKGKQEAVVRFKESIEKVNQRMNPEVTCKIITYKSLTHLQELVSLVHNQQPQTTTNLIYLICHSNQQKTEKELFEKTLQSFINGCIPFHLLQTASLQGVDQESLEQSTYQHLSTIYTKFRLNPWKLKSLPFLSQPMMLISLHIQATKEGLQSVALVATMNLFFTKFTAILRATTLDNVSQTVTQGVIECVSTFQSKHQRYPTRIFLAHSDASTSDQLNLDSAREQLKNIGSTLTYISLDNRHQVRMYTQHDSNYLAKDSVKKVQLTAYMTINQQLYYQLELERPPHRVNIEPVQNGDPNFVLKVLELLSRVVQGGAGQAYGEGLGILDYPSKLNKYREFNLSKWEHNLKQGIFMFL